MHYTWYITFAYVIAMCKTKQSTPVPPVLPEPHVVRIGDKIVITGPRGPYISNIEHRREQVCTILTNAHGIDQLSEYSTVLNHKNIYTKQPIGDVYVGYKSSWLGLCGYYFVISFSASFTNEALEARAARAAEALVAEARAAEALVAEARAAEARAAHVEAPDVAPTALVSSVVEAVTAEVRAARMVSAALEARMAAATRAATRMVSVAADATLYAASDVAIAAIDVDEAPVTLDAALDAAPAAYYTFAAVPTGVARPSFRRILPSQFAVTSLSAILENRTEELIATVQDARENHEAQRLATPLAERAFRKWQRTVKKLKLANI